uniref:Tetratricopeptide repeat protein n=1 Tax=Fervidobacterium thailandense TaxID=1008305 RepID=A0A7C5RII4_9BACT
MRRLVECRENHSSNILRTTLIIFVAFVLSVYGAVIDEQKAREYFSGALKEFYDGNIEAAYESAIKALSGRVYVQELPHFWYLRGRLAIINGEVDKALQEFRNFTTLVKNDDIDNLVQKVESFRKLNLSRSQSFEFGYVTTLRGKQAGVDYFHSIVSVAVYGDELYALDSRNKRLVKFKENKITQIRNLSREYKQVSVDRMGSVLLLSKEALYDAQEKELLKDLRTPVIAGISRDGEVYLVDLDTVVIYSLTKRNARRQSLGRRVICLDAELTVDKLFILDGINQEILVYNVQDMKIIERLKPPIKTWSFEVTPYGDLIYLGDNKIIVGEKDFTLKDVNLIEYSYPILFAIKWAGSTVDVYQLIDDKPVFVSIDKMEFDELYAYAYVRVEDIFGDTLHFIQNLLSIAEQDVYTPSFVSFKNLEPKFVNLKACEKELVVYRLRGVKVSGNCPLLAKFTGNGVTENVKTQSYWIFRWQYIRPVPDGIIKVTARFSTKSKVFFDTMFYTNLLLKSSMQKGQ